MFYKDGSMYVGLWQDGKYNGKGQLIVKGDKVLSGVWKDGEMIFGREDFAAKGVNDQCNSESKEYYYEGNFRKGKRHGKGKLVMPNGVIYEGDFYHGSKHGRGLMIKTDGSRFDGQFEDDHMHGDFEITDAEGNRRMVLF